MPCTQPSSQRTRPVRLTDVPREQRLQAAHQVIRHEADPWERLRIMLLADNPPPSLVAYLRP